MKELTELILLGNNHNQIILADRALIKKRKADAKFKLKLKKYFNKQKENNE